MLASVIIIFRKRLQVWAVEAWKERNIRTLRSRWFSQGSRTFLGSWRRLDSHPKGSWSPGARMKHSYPKMTLMTENLHKHFNFKLTQQSHGGKTGGDAVSSRRTSGGGVLGLSSICSSQRIQAELIQVHLTHQETCHIFVFCGHLFFCFLILSFKF